MFWSNQFGQSEQARRAFASAVNRIQTVSPSVRDEILNAHPIWSRHPIAFAEWLVEVRNTEKSLSDCQLRQVYDEGSSDDRIPPELRPPNPETFGIRNGYFEAAEEGSQAWNCRTRWISRELTIALRMVSLL